MGGDDIAHIRQMLDYTSKSVKHHSKAYSNIKEKVHGMNQDAESALRKISQHNEDVQSMLKETEELNRKL